jgi:DNA-binding MarR family transcriptional regulator
LYIQILIPEKPVNDSTSKSFASCTCLQIRKVSRAVTQFYDWRLKPAGLRTTQFSILAALHGAGRITRTELARRLAMDHSTLTRNLAPLGRAGLVETVPGRDRRTRTVRLTAKGRKKLARATPLWEEAQAHMTQGLGEPGLADLFASLAKAFAAVRTSA